MSELTEEEVVMTEEEYLEKETDEFQQAIQPDSELKTLIVNYVGTKHSPENDEVTLAMAIETFADEFSEFLLPIAEENFIRGYQQAMYDVEEGEKLFAENTTADGEIDMEKLEERLNMLDLEREGVQEED